MDNAKLDAAADKLLGPGTYDAEPDAAADDLLGPGAYGNDEDATSDDERVLGLNYLGPVLSRRSPHSDLADISLEDARLLHPATHNKKGGPTGATPWPPVTRTPWPSAPGAPWPPGDAVQHQGKA